MRKQRGSGWNAWLRASRNLRNTAGEQAQESVLGEQLRSLADELWSTAETIQTRKLAPEKYRNSENAALVRSHTAQLERLEALLAAQEERAA